MLNKLIVAVLIAASMSSAAFAGNPIKLSDENKVHIRKKLAAEGYEVVRVKIENGAYEAYARKDGARFEVYLNGDFAIVRTKQSN